MSETTANGGAEPLVLVVNPGSVSTKVALYRGDDELFQEEIRHSDAELAPFAGRAVLDQLELRQRAVRAALELRELDLTTLAAVVGRGGLLRPVHSGAYVVDAGMLEELKAAARGEHASNLGAFLAVQLAEPAGCDCYVVDPVSVDEWDELARFSGLAGLDRESLSHALNTKAVARRYAGEQGKPYHRLRLVVVHLGSGITVSAHREGRMVDATNSREEGAFSCERTGTLPLLAFAHLIIERGWRLPDVVRAVFREGGVYSYIGTRDLREVLHRVDQGDEEARRVFDAMLYQVKKEAGAMAAVLEGRVDAVLVTGGMARAPRVVEELARGLRWIAPVVAYPGEDELRALAEGALLVLRGQERARRLQDTGLAVATAR